MENKAKIVKSLLATIKETRYADEINNMEYEQNSETVLIVYASGHEERVNVACNSGIAIIQDVMKSLRL